MQHGSRGFSQGGTVAYGEGRPRNCTFDCYRRAWMLVALGDCRIVGRPEGDSILVVTLVRFLSSPLKRRLVRLWKLLRQPEVVNCEYQGADDANQRHDNDDASFDHALGLTHVAGRMFFYGLVGGAPSSHYRFQVGVGCYCWASDKVGVRNLRIPLLLLFFLFFFLTKMEHAHVGDWPMIRIILYFG